MDAIHHRESPVEAASRPRPMGRPMVVQIAPSGETSDGAGLSGEKKLSVKEAATLMSISAQKVRQLINDGALPAIRIDSIRLVLLRDVEAFLQSRYVTTTTRAGDTHPALRPLPQSVMKSPHLRRA